MGNRHMITFSILKPALVTLRCISFRRYLLRCPARRSFSSSILPNGTVRMRQPPSVRTLCISFSAWSSLGRCSRTSEQIMISNLLSENGRCCASAIRSGASPNMGVTRFLWQRQPSLIGPFRRSLRRVLPWCIGYSQFHIQRLIVAYWIHCLKVVALAHISRRNHMIINDKWRRCRWLLWVLNCSIFQP